MREKEREKKRPKRDKDTDGKRENKDKEQTIAVLTSFRQDTMTFQDTRMEVILSVSHHAGRTPHIIHISNSQ